MWHSCAACYAVPNQRLWIAASSRIARKKNAKPLGTFRGHSLTQCRCKLCEQCKLKSCRCKLPNFRRIKETQKSCNCFPFWCSTCHLKIDSLSLGFPVPNPFQIIGNEPCISKVHLFNSFQMILVMSYANASASIPYLSSTTRYKSGSPGNKNAANINSSSCHVTKIYKNRARIVTW